ncbi:unnamed protein product [Clonostachys byssicola]|uniref:Uncharacterized protein n=1 Tax=Clonostachys byssicola TaxID=160290 RepID=A0A9N9V1U2_9HYPO|nr:unnamed protein product [Clonostachys byssicola]
MPSSIVLAKSPSNATTGKGSSQKQHEPKAQSLMEQAVPSGDVAGVEQSLAQGANATEPMHGHFPLCVAIRNGEDDVAIFLLQHYPAHSLQPAPWAESLDRFLLRLGMFPINYRYLPYFGRLLAIFVVVFLLYKVPDVFPFKVTASPAVHIIPPLGTEILCFLFSKYYQESPSHAGVVGAQAINAFLDSKIQSERLLLELLDRGLISPYSASFARLRGVAAGKEYAEATRRLAALSRAPPESNEKRASTPHS